MLAILLQFQNWSLKGGINTGLSYFIQIANNQINVLQSKFRDIMNECVALDASKLDALGWLGGAVIVNPVNNEVWISCQV